MAPYVLRAQHDDSCDSDPVRVEVRDGESANAPDLLLKAGGTLVLRVVDERGDSIPTPVPTIRLTGSQWKFPTEREPSAEPGGEWRLRAIAPGTYVVDVRHDGFLTTHEVASVSPGRDGRYESGRLPEGDYGVVVAADGWTTLRRSGVHVAAGDAATADFTLVRSGSIRVHVSRATGQPAPGRFVFVVRHEPGDERSTRYGNWTRSGETDSSGDLTFDHIEPGDYVVNAVGTVEVKTAVTVRDGQTTPAALSVP